MVVDPGWEKQIVAYHLQNGEWITPEACQFARAKDKHALTLANPYTWNMILNRYTAGKDVPSWLVFHANAEIKLRMTA